MMESVIEGNEDNFKKIFDINLFGVYLINKTIQYYIIKENNPFIQ